MNKTKRFRMSIFMLLIILSNFFIGVFIPIANALSKGEIYLYSESIKETIDLVKDNIVVSESDPLYLTDNAFKESVIYIKEQVNDLEVEFNNTISDMESSNTLENIVTLGFPTKELEYETYLSSNNIVIDLDDIKDITYSYMEEEIEKTVTFLTKNEIETFFKSYYLASFDISVNNYSENYSTILASYIKSYNDFISDIDGKIEYLNVKKAEIETFIEGELLLLNNPSMDVNNENIYSLIDSAKTSLEAEKLGITISKLSLKETIVKKINDNILDSIATFYLNNKTYTENGIDLEIENINSNLNDFNTELESWYADINDYKNSNISNYIDSIDNDLINLFKDIINFENDYEKLIMKITSYLERRPSDTDDINILLTNINEKRDFINKEKILSNIKLIVDTANLNDEDVIDILYGFIDIEDLGKTTKNKIIDAKLVLYPLTLKDETNYKLEKNGDYLILSNIVSELDKTLFFNNLDYGTFKKEIIETNNNITNDSVLKLYDKNDVLIKTYNILIKGDINTDNKFDTNDIDIFKEKLTQKEMFTDVEKLILNYNSDEKIDIADLVIAGNIINNIVISGNTTDGSFEIDREAENDLICYNILLRTDGKISGFSFDISHSDNLLFDSIKSSYLNNGLNINNLNDPTRVVGIKNHYENDLNILTLCYKEDMNKDLTNEMFRLYNINIIYDNGDLKEIDEALLISVKDTIKEETKATQKRVVYYTHYEDVEENKENEEQEELPNIIENEPKEKEEIMWSNIIKIIIIVLLGAAIIYLLNKNEDEKGNKATKTKKDTK